VSRRGRAWRRRAHGPPRAGGGTRRARCPAAPRPPRWRWG
jgi:hypothetical protein